MTIPEPSGWETLVKIGLGVLGGLASAVGLASVFAPGTIAGIGQSIAALFP